jgi:ribosome biogenesis SPOUT family RNA methylase Rps3
MLRNRPRGVRQSEQLLMTLVPLDRIPYIDFPELKLDDHESTQMPFRYVKRDDGKPVMPEVRLAF